MTRNTVIHLHRSTELPDEWYADHIPCDYDTRPQTQLHTTDELIFAAWLGGFVGIVVTLGAAFVWSFFL